MILVVHILAGAAVGAKLANPYAALPAAFISHFILDALPHWEYAIDHLKGKRRDQLFFLDLFKVAVDLLGGLLIIGVLILKTCQGGNVLNPLLIMASGFLGAFPDAITFLSWQIKSSLLSKINHGHRLLQESDWALRKKYNPRTWGLAIELTTVVLALFLIIY